MTSELDIPEIGTDEHTVFVAKQNDQFRRWCTLRKRGSGTFVPGKLVWTASFGAEEPAFKQAAITAIGAMDTFDPDNDPEGFHDFGSVQIEGRAVWFKIDHYDRDYNYGSEDPANLQITRRLMTVLFPSDW